MASYYVYKHTFPNDKVYIGITSMKPEARWRGGKGYRRKQKGKWVQPLMARAVGKYNWDDIKHEVLFEGLTKEEAEAKEVELIAFYKSDNPEYGYNIEHGGNSNGKHAETTKKKISEAKTGVAIGPFSEDHKRKIGEANKGKVRKDLSERNKLASISVICVETNIVYESCKEAERLTGINHSSILRVCRGERKTAGGFHWAYYTEQIAV